MVSAPYQARIVAGRVALLRPKQPLIDAARVPAAIDGGALREAKLPEKLLAQHGPTLVPATADLARLAALGAELEPAQARAYEAVLARFHAALGGLISAAPAPARIETARRAAAAVARVAERLERSQPLLAALSASTALIDLETRLCRGKPIADPAGVAEGAARTVLGLLESTAGRRGVPSMLNALPNLTEQLAFGAAPAPAGAGGAEKLAAAVSRLLVEATPTVGCDLALLSQVGERIAEGLAAEGGAPHKALERAKDALLAGSRDAFLAARARLSEPPRAFPPEWDESKNEARLSSALRSVVEASPAGPPALFEAAVRLADKTRGLIAAQKPHDCAFFAPLAEGLRTLAGCPAAAEVLAYLADNLAELQPKPAARQAIEALRAAPDAGAFGRALVLLQLEVRGQAPAAVPGFEAALARLEELEPAARVQVALAAIPLLLPPNGGLVLAALVDVARSKPDDPAPALASFASRMSVIVARASNRPEAERLATAAKLAGLLSGDAVDPGRLNVVRSMLDQLIGALPAADLVALLAPDASGRPGVVAATDPGVHFLCPPLPLLTHLTNAIHGVNVQVVGGPKPPADFPGADRVRATELGRVAITIATNLGRMGPNVQPLAGRIGADLAKVLKGEVALKMAVRNGAAPAPAPSLEAFLRAHPELPIEMAVSAGVALTPEQLGWMVERIASARGHGVARALRDFVFAAIEHKRLDVVEAVRTSRSPARAINAAIDHIAQSFRLGRAAGAMYFDPIVQALAKGEDPINAMRSGEAKEVGGLDLAQLADGKLSAAGVAELNKMAVRLHLMLENYKEGAGTLDPGVQTARLRPILLEFVKSVAQGTWPAPKYQSEVGRRIMAQLSPAQAAVWRARMITPAKAAAGAPAPAAAPPAMARALELAKGLALALPEQIAADPTLPDLRWDAQSLARVRVIREHALAVFRATQKGSLRHREAGKRLIVASEYLALLDLHQGLSSGALEQDPVGALLSLAPKLRAAIAPLRRRGEGLGDAATDVLAAASELSSGVAAEGRYAADEDSFEALTNSHTSGCLSDGRRTWGLCGAAGDANIRMLRVFQGDKQLYRGFLKFFQAEVPGGYKGPILYMDPPVADGGGQPDDRLLLFEHALRKGQAMGIPVAGPYELTAIGQRLGYEVRPATQAQLRIDEGTIGYIHSDALFGGIGDIRGAKKPGETYAERMYSIGPMVMPKPKA
jgi:hypothetical protein